MDKAACSDKTQTGFRSCRISHHSRLTCRCDFEAFKMKWKVEGVKILIRWRERFSQWSPVLSCSYAYECRNTAHRRCVLQTRKTGRPVLKTEFNM